MGKFLGGFALAAGLAAGAFWWVGADAGDDDDCRGLCGAGTVCEGGLCVPETEAEPAVDEGEGKGRKRRRRGRRRGRSGGDAAGTDAGFTPVDDSHVPAFSNAPIDLDRYPGSERLPDREVDRHMERLVPRFQACITAAARASDEDLGRGTITFKIRLGPDGRVDGVSARAPGNLQVFGIVPCVRVAVHRHRFPTFDGPPMKIDFSFDVD